MTKQIEKANLLRCVIKFQNLLHTEHVAAAIIQRTLFINHKLSIWSYNFSIKQYVQLIKSLARGSDQFTILQLSFLSWNLITQQRNCEV
jgi:hypothetical protein